MLLYYYLFSLLLFFSLCPFRTPYVPVALILISTVPHTSYIMYVFTEYNNVTVRPGSDDGDGVTSSGVVNY